MSQEADDVIMALRDEDECGGCHRVCLKADLICGACPECDQTYSDQMQQQWEIEQQDKEDDERRARREREDEERYNNRSW